ncbi:hypothetical protein BLA24_02585 [Streptomyces cinnamoneus]|uniref:FAD-binding domain-containing protein n=1 Tax=Streptomyces cinnamoneus TaxID=53446 RepID=A0A2G1XPS7_STRCJ|nr:FAD-dependent monooxygenase [Streptomyces cinnamoneus]PHQ53220.1 hypothetical protein BLA24_02585 [Streptomyces cinnamoneus]PPT12312.1 FAD-dependent oxidoreductase [Streptomyces cinnamoneus]
MKTVIIGAGVSGVASALALSREHEVTVYEQADELRADGNGVLLYPNATGLLRTWGIRLDDLGVRVEALDLLSEYGETLLQMDMAAIARRYRHPVIVGKRGGVLAALAERLPAGTVQFGKQLTGIKYRTDRPRTTVVASFSDGSEVECDALIGADGHRSAVREHLLGHDPAAYCGDATWHGITALPHGFSEGDRIHSLYSHEGICVMHPVGDGQVYWAFELPWREGDTAPPGKPGGHGFGHPGVPVEGSPVENLRARFGHWTGGALPQLLETITDDDISVFPHIMHHVRPYWGDGPVTLAGDAAHVVPPRLGMGLCQALEDAWVLERAMSGPGTANERLRAYEGARWPRLRRMRTIAEVMGRRTLPAPPKLAQRIGRFVPMTAYQQLQVKRLSNYLNDDAPGTGASVHIG